MRNFATASEGLQKLKLGKDLIKKCRGRLQQVENEFVKLKQDYADDVADGESSEVFESRQDPTPTSKKNGQVEPDDIPW